MKQKVKVIIPIYRCDLTKHEEESLKNTMNKLSNHPIVFLKPENVDLSSLAQSYPEAEIINVSTDWLGTKKGIAGYNEMMMSAKFYSMFSDCEFIFICHIDAWIFRDELDYWCDMGYDLIAAPWPARPYYKLFPFKQYFNLKRRLNKGKVIHCSMYDKIGNGGLCLRKVKPFIKACEEYGKEIAMFKEKSLTNELYNEDLFWALIPKNISYPSVETALKFSYDLKPALCHKLNNHQLPMACHGYTKKSRLTFWSDFIPYLNIKS
jgi:hypothetical protein